MDRDTLIAQADFARARLLGLLAGVEKSGQDVAKVLAWRPGPGRAHLAWQAMHCAATHDRYVNVRLRGATESDPDLVKHFGGGSTPADTDIPSLETIRTKLEATFVVFKDFIKNTSDTEMARVMDFPNNVKRSVAESVVLLIWHESHHQGQMHLTWNLYKAAYGVA